MKWPVLHVLQDNAQEQSKEQKFCRVLLPDGSTTVLDGGAGEKLSAVLGKLCERRNLVPSQLDVCVIGQDKVRSSGSK